MMRRIGILSALVLAGMCTCALVAVGASEKPDGRSFDGIVRAVNLRYHLHGKGVPMMGIVSVVARAASHGGVRGMRVVTYEELGGGVDREGLEETVGAELGEGWSAMVRERSATEMSLVYVQPAGKRVRVIVVSLDGGELDLVRMDLSPDALAKWGGAKWNKDGRD